MLPTLYSLEGQYFYVLDLTGADIVVAKAVNPEEMVIDYCLLPQTSMRDTEADEDQECPQQAHFKMHKPEPCLLLSGGR